MRRKMTISGVVFDASAKTLDFSGAGVGSFDVARLYAVIHADTQALLYAMAAPGKGYTAIAGNVLTLEADTTALADSDALTILYDADDSAASQAGQDALSVKIGEVQASPSANTLLGRLKDIAGLLAGTLTVGLPSGAATGAKQDTAIAGLAAIDGKLGASLPLPTGAATSAKQDTSNAALGAPADEAYSTGNGTIVGLLKGIYAKLASLLSPGTIATGQVSVATTVGGTQIVAARAGRKSVTIRNLTGSDKIYVGNSGLTGANGALGALAVVGDGITIDGSQAIYGIVATTAQTVSYLENF